MKRTLYLPLLVGSLAVMSGCSSMHHDTNAPEATPTDGQALVQLGPRPYFLVNNMDEGKLKQSLQACESKPVTSSTFSIGHRGAPMQFPEHTRESYIAAARMGAGIVEDRKSTRLNSSHVRISYAVFCLKK